MSAFHPLQTLVQRKRIHQLCVGLSVLERDGLIKTIRWFVNRIGEYPGFAASQVPCVLEHHLHQSEPDTRTMMRRRNSHFVDPELWRLVRVYVIDCGNEAHESYTVHGDSDVMARVG